MKKKALISAQSDGATVAYVPFGRDDTEFGYEVRIIDVDAVRTVHGRSRAEMFGSGHEAHGVLIEYVDRPHHDRQREVVPAVKLRSRWTDFVETRDSRKEHEASRQARVDMSKDDAEKAKKRLTEILKRDDIPVRFDAVEVVSIGGYNHGRHWQPPYAYGVRVSPDVLDYLLAHFEE